MDVAKFFGTNLIPSW